MKRKLYLTLKFYVLAFCAIVLSPDCVKVTAQDSPKAFFMVDIDMQKLRDNEMFSNFVDKATLEEVSPELRGTDLSVSDIKRIRAAAAPSVVDFALVVAKTDKARSEKMQELGMFGKIDADTYDEKEEEKKWKQLDEFEKELLKEIQKQRPQFFVQFEFTNAKAAKSLLENENLAPAFSDDMLNGKAIKRTPSGKMFGIYYDGNTKITVASDQFLLGDTALDATTSIEKYFLTHSDRAIRIGVDLDSVRPQINKIKELGEIPPMVFGIVDAIRSASVALDLTNDELANFVVNTDNEDNAELIASQINGLLRMAKMQASQAANELFAEGSDEAGTMIDFVKGLKCNVDGASAAMRIVKPNGFEKIVMRAAEKAREAAKRVEKMNYFRQVGIGLLNAHEAYDSFPFPEPMHSSISKELSWRVVVLPFIEQNILHEQFDMKQAWDSETNLPLSKNIPEIYTLGEDSDKTSVCWIKATDKKVRFRDIRDGTSNTIMLMENPNKVAWSKPGDLSIDEAVNLVKNLKDGEELAVVFYDSSVRTVSNKMDPEKFKAFLTLNGGEIVDWSEIK